MENIYNTSETHRELQEMKENITFEEAKAFLQRAEDYFVSGDQQGIKNLFSDDAYIELALSHDYRQQIEISTYLRLVHRPPKLPLPSSHC